MEVQITPPSVYAQSLHSSRAIFWSTVLGGPLAGAFLLSQNFSRLGQPRAARLTVGWGLLAFAVFMLLLLLLPERIAGFIPNHVLVFGGFWVIWGIFNAYQEEAVQGHFTAGGRKASVRAAVGLSALGVLAALWITLVLSLLVTLGAPATVPHDGLTTFEERFIGKQLHAVEGGGEISYAGTVTGEQAAHVSEILRLIGYWQQDLNHSVLIDGGSDRYTLLLDIDPAYWDDNGLRDLLWSLHADLSRYLEKPLVIQAVGLGSDGQIVEKTFSWPDHES